MILRTLVVLALLFPIRGDTADFMSLCTSKTRPKGFDELIQINLHKLNLVLGNPQVCKSIHKEVVALTSLNVDTTLKPISLDILREPELFPNLTSISLAVDEPLRVLKIGNHPNLTSLDLVGSLEVSDFGDVLHCRKLNSIRFNGHKGSSWVDIKQISQFPLLRLDVHGVSIRNAKTIESLRDLQSVRLVGTTLDGPIDWSLLPNLRTKTIK